MITLNNNTAFDLGYQLAAAVHAEDSISKTIVGHDAREEWIYRLELTLYFEDGKLTSCLGCERAPAIGQLTRVEMLEDDVLRSFGEPDSISKTVVDQDAREEWIYRPELPGDGSFDE